MHSTVLYAAVICTENNSESVFIHFLQETHPFGKNKKSCQVRPLQDAGLCHPLPPQNLTGTGKRQGLLFTLLFSNNSKILTPPPSHIHTLVRSFTFSDNNIIRLSSLDRLRTSIDFGQSHPFVKTGGVVPASAPGFATPGSLNYRSAEAWPGCLLGSGLIAMSPILSVPLQLSGRPISPSTNPSPVTHACSS
jgi:hypothetical protein